ncbi:thiamine pyrophosphate-binding protein [Georgenia sp. Z1344]|uniref:thiamine pyrophosphate-binding protein n=1 Tax=Georgenia sp. Z1344 TaxID=3416706 RepID=UPI003CF42EB6
MSAHGRTLVSEVVGQTLAELGVSHVFGVVGSGNFEATEALVRAGASFVGTRHESAATGAADAYWRTSGAIAVCTVHQGPGLTNTLTALADAAKARSALVVIAGATSAGATRSNFYIDQARLVEAAGGVAERIYGAATVAQDVRRAYRRALVERRPVVLDMPLDVQGEVIVGPLPPSAPVAPLPRTVPAADSLDALARAVRAASRPVIVAGRGAWQSGGTEQITDLAEAIGAALATTALAKGMFAGHARDVGIAGGFSDQPAVEALESADLILALGASLTTWTTRGDTIFDHAPTVVQVDDDPVSLSLNDHVDLEVLGDVRETVSALLETLRAEGAAATVVEPEPRGLQEREVDADETAGAGDRATDRRCHPGDITCALDEILPAARTLVVDGGHFIGWPVRCIGVPDPAGFVFSSAGFQSIGLGIGAAIGAAVARTDRLTVLAAGDGGLLMSLPELETLSRLDHPVAVIIYNDAAYGAEVHHFRRLGSGLDLVQFPETDFASVAATLGLRSSVVRGTDDLADFRSWCGEPNGAYVLDLRIDPDVVGPWAEQDFLGH